MHAKKQKASTYQFPVWSAQPCEQWYYQMLEMQQVPTSLSIPAHPETAEWSACSAETVYSERQYFIPGTVYTYHIRINPNIISNPI